MKASHTSSKRVERPGIELGRLCEIVNTKREADACEAYLVSRVHSEFLFLPSLMARCEAQAAEFRRGEVPLASFVDENPDALRVVFTCDPGFRYKACVPNSDVFGDADEARRALVYHADLADMPPDEIEAVLLNDVNCVLTDEPRLWHEDDERRNAFVNALCAYLHAAAALAKGLSSPSAAQFAEALRRILALTMEQRPVYSDDMTLNFPAARKLASDEVTDLISRIVEAHGALWSDWTVAKLTPIAPQGLPRRKGAL